MVVSMKSCNIVYLKSHGNVTNSMEQRPSWEANSCSASQEIPSLLWKLKVHYLVYKKEMSV
jgi:hypothetical protein